MSSSLPKNRQKLGTPDRMDTLMYPKLVSKPSIERIKQDLLDCINQLKQEFLDSGIPITDDCQFLQKTCAKLEYLLTYEMKDHISIMGRRKSYWEYFCECLGSSKGLKDGLKYVKSLKEYRTSIGKGRALIRFALVHKRLADTIQQCVSNGRVTSDWYHPSSPWLQHKHSSILIDALYDLNDVNFDLIPIGYDLDNTWPSFARKNPGSYTWNPPSRTSSMSSLLSITSQYDSSQMSKVDVASSFTESECMSPIEDEEVSASHSDLLTKIEELKEEKLTTDQEVTSWVEKLNVMREKYATLQQKYDDLCKNYDCTQEEKENLDFERRDLQEKLNHLQRKLNEIEQEHQRIIKEKLSKIAELKQREADLLLEVQQLKSDRSKQTEIGETQVDSTEVSEEELLKIKFAKEKALLSEENNCLQTQCKDIEELQQLLREHSDEMDDLRKQVEEKARLVETYQRESQQFKQVLDNVLDTEDNPRSYELFVDKELGDTFGKFVNYVKEIKTSQVEKQEELSNAKSQNATLEERLQRVTLNLENSQKELASLNEILDDQKCKAENLEQLNINLLRQKEEVDERLSAAEVEYEELKLRYDKLEQEYIENKSESEMQLSDEIKKNQEVVDNLQSIKNSLEQTLDKLFEEKKQMAAENENLKAEAEKLRKESECLKKDRADLQQQLESISIESQKSGAVRETLQSVIDALNVDKSRLLQENERLITSEQTFTSELQEKDCKISSLEQNMEDAQEMFSNELHMVKQELSAAQFQLSAQQLQYQQTVKAISSKENDLLDEQQKLKEKDDILSKLQEEKELQAAEYQKQQIYLQELLEKTQTQLKNSEQQYISLQKKYEEVSSFHEDKSKIELAKNQEIVKQKDEEIVVLREDLRELKKRLIKLLREKDSLWKQTDKLVYSQKMEAMKKWMDNNEVTNCLGCKSAFSFTLRKHHCRLCGAIYCHNCSNHWVMTTHSSRKSRACDRCYQEQKERADDSSSSILCAESEEEDKELSEGSSQRRSTKWSESASDVSDVLGSTNTLKDHNDDLDSLLRYQSSDVGQSSLASNDISRSEYLENSAEENSRHFEEAAAAVPSETCASEPQSQDIPQNKEVTIAKNCPKNSPSDFAVISDDEVAKMRTEKTQSDNDAAFPESITVSLEELEKGEINSQSVIWIRYGCTYTVSVVVDRTGFDICWEFTTYPKDISFGVHFIPENCNSKPSSQESSQILVPVQKCNSHKQTIKGQLTPRDLGIYKVIFDNTYSRLTSKKVTYTLRVQKAVTASWSRL